MEQLCCIFCEMKEKAEPSSFSGADGLIMVFGSLFLIIGMFMLWTKTPAGRDEFGND